MEQFFVDLSLPGEGTPKGDPAPGTMLSSCSQALTNPQLSLAVVNFSEFACFISQKGTIVDWQQASYRKAKQPQD